MRCVKKSISVVKLLWWAAECWEENLKLLNIAETAIQTKESSFNNGELAQSSYGFIARTRGILRPAVTLKNIMNDVSSPKLQIYTQCNTLNCKMHEIAT